MNEKRGDVEAKTRHEGMNGNGVGKGKAELNGNGHGLGKGVLFVKRLVLKSNIDDFELKCCIR